MAKLHLHHLAELRASAIADKIMRANFRSSGGADVFEWLTEHRAASFGGHADQYATG